MLLVISIFQLYQLLSKMVALIFTPAVIFTPNIWYRLFQKHFYDLMGLWGCDLGKGSLGRVAGTEDRVPGLRESGRQ